MFNVPPPRKQKPGSGQMQAGISDDVIPSSENSAPAAPVKSLSYNMRGADLFWSWASPDRLDNER